MDMLAALKELEPQWKGPWHEDELREVPASPGVFCVCACLPDDSRQGWRLLRPVYIGVAQDVRQRVMDSEDWDSWRELAGPGHQLCIGYLPAPPGRQAMLQGAMVAYYRPLGNPAPISL